VAESSGVVTISQSCKNSSFISSQFYLFLLFEMTQTLQFDFDDFYISLTIV
jgi:hypothetical protein